MIRRLSTLSGVAASLTLNCWNPPTPLNHILYRLRTHVDRLEGTFACYALGQIGRVTTCEIVVVGSSVDVLLRRCKSCPCSLFLYVRPYPSHLQKRRAFREPGGTGSTPCGGSYSMLHVSIDTVSPRVHCKPVQNVL
jgi:hypothetical protein